MKVYYDLHIHTCLSPCADNDMTPSNIVNMAKLIGLDVIAITDHNSIKNCEAAVKAATEIGGITVLPGAELETSEEVHVLMLFPNTACANGFAMALEEKRIRIKNRPDIYGEQLIVDEDDNVTGSEENLLVTATMIGIYEASRLAESFGGVAVPAHINRPSNSVLANLGFLGADMGFMTIEMTSLYDEQLAKKYEAEGYRIIRDSDAHSLEQIAEKEHYIELDELTAENFIAALRTKK